MSTPTERAKRLAKYAALIYDDLTLNNETESVSKDVVQLLAAPIGRLTKVLIPNSHQKLDEVIFASENNLTVNSHQHGADLFTAEGHPMELKISVATKSNGYTAQFNWPVPGKGSSAAERRKRLLASIANKTKGGFATLIIKNGLSRELGHYTLCYQFLHEYFTRITIGKSDKHLMVAKQCRKCKKYHRFEKYQAASTLVENGSPTQVKWDEVMAKTKEQCL
jgi:hypothetical protein